jgi:hypothetical protein
MHVGLLKTGPLCPKHRSGEPCRLAKAPGGPQEDAGLLNERATGPHKTSVMAKVRGSLLTVLCSVVLTRLLWFVMSGNSVVAGGLCLE